MPHPLLLLADKQVRDDIGTVSTLFLESISITGLLYTVPYTLSIDTGPLPITRQYPWTKE
jgi:hypothetical protein